MANQAFDEYQIGQFGAAEFQVVEVTVNGPVRAHLVGNHLDRGPFPHEREYFIQLSPHDRGPADLTMQYGLVEHCTVLRRLVLVKQFLPYHSGFHALAADIPLDLRRDTFDDLPGLVLALHQSSHAIPPQPTDTPR